MSVTDRQIMMIRHAECEANDKGLICGLTDSPLSKGGLSALKNLSLVDVNLRWNIYCSTLTRASDTARSIFSEDLIEYSKDLIEIDYGLLEMRPQSTHKNQLHDFGKQWEQLTSTLPGTYVSVASDILKSREENRLLITHGGLINIILHTALGISLDQFPLFVIDNLHAVLLSTSDEGAKWMVKAINMGPERWKHELV